VRQDSNTEGAAELNFSPFFQSDGFCFDDISDLVFSASELFEANPRPALIFTTCFSTLALGIYHGLLIPQRHPRIDLAARFAAAKAHQRD